MKRILLFIVSIVLLSCDSENEPVIQDAALHGEWMLQEISCFCGFEPETDFSETKMFFDTENSKLTVINEGTSQFFKEAGEYYYGGQSNILDFTDSTSYQFQVKGRQLSLVYLDNPNIADDEVAYFFIRPR